MAIPMGSMNFEGKKVRSTSESLELDTEIGSGKEGLVLSVKGRPSTVVKIFYPESRSEKEDKIRAMVKEYNHPTDRTRDETGIRSIIWPQEVVEDQLTQEFLGYLMPREDPDNADTALVYAISELDWGSNQESRRLGTALNLAIMVSEMHQQGHAIGDFNHKNILIEDGFVKLIDSDGFHIKDQNKVYPGETYGRRYAPPEGRPENIEDVRKADRFGLAIHIFQFLMEGHHPFRVKGADSVGGNWRVKIKQNPFPYADSNSNTSPPDKVGEEYEKLPEEIKEKFYECFVDGRENKDKRPTPEEWESTIRKVIGFDKRSDNHENKINSHTPSNEKGSGTRNWDTSTGTDQTDLTDTANRRSSTNGVPETTPSAGGEPLAPKPSSVRNDSLSLERSQLVDIAMILKAEMRRFLFYIGYMLLILLVGYILLGI